ncbi:uncharacterized protein LOC128556292 isoform X2 [Mercenaria mercenaria]|uniref:uncharacterized protein LOC128556292 isoform X2 n=1 Tax=Mercenaria mercenaria TaxID=6596 RepID=UPI00234EFE15|nr:uncharacterized protein LOC128556292 isoform X2 [Mercenaria mercenaria]
MDRPALQGAKHVLVSGADLENLPSFGMSAYMNLASGAETAAMLENIKDGKYPTPKQGNGNQLKPPCSGPSRMAPPSTSSRHGQEVQVIIQDDKEYEQQDPDESATAPISSTVDASQIMETEVNSPQSLV